MNAKAGHPEQKIGHRTPGKGKLVARPGAADDPKSVLKSFGAHIHLIDAHSHSNLDIMLATSHVECVID